MPITLACTCGARLQAKDEWLGEKIRCPVCQGILLVPAPAQEEEIPEINDIEVVEEEKAEEEDSGATYALDPEDAQLPPILPGQGNTRNFAGEIGTLPLNDRATALAYSPGHHWALAATGSNIHIFEMKDHQKAYVLTAHRDSVCSLAFSPDAGYVLSGDDEGGLLLWDVKQGRPLRWLDGHKGPVRCLAFAPNARFALSGGEDGTIRLWELDTGREFGLQGAHWNAPVNAVAYSRDGKKLLAGGDDGSVRVWRVKTGEIICPFKNRNRPIQTVAFSLDGNFAQAGHGLRVWKWKIEIGKMIPCFENPSSPNSTVFFSAFLPGGDDLLTMGMFGSNQGPLDDSAIFHHEGMILPFMIGGIRGIYIANSFNPRLARGPRSHLGKYNMQIWNVETGNRGASIDCGDNVPQCFALSAQGSRVLTSSPMGIHVWGLGRA